MTVDIQIRRAPEYISALFLIGPGGVGKSTVGALVAPLLDFSFIDLDALFMERVGPIGAFIGQHGYERYQKVNSELAHDAVRKTGRPFVVALSSGFLTTDRTPLLGEQNGNLIRASGYAIVVMPAADMDEAADIVVSRQLGRGFGLRADREREKFRARCERYLAFGDMQVFSSAPAPDIASAIANRLLDYRRKTIRRAN